MLFGLIGLTILCEIWRPSCDDVGAGVGAVAGEVTEGLSFSAGTAKRVYLLWVSMLFGLVGFTNLCKIWRPSCADVGAEVGAVAG